MKNSIIVCFNFPILPEKWVYKFAKKESERLCNQCELIIVPSEEMKLQLQHYNINTPLEIIPTGINKVDINENEINLFKEKYHIKDEPYCIFIGRLGFEKNIYFLIDAFEEIKKSIDHLNLLIIGDGPEKNKLIKIINNKQLNQHITLTGYLNKKDVFEKGQNNKILTLCPHALKKLFICFCVFHLI